ncbi:hypothetical protein GH714_014594 [Hevea brasiliensis]|uniref:Uncharacterized protein n=1 Tax=Hevea brasiliensis TaxID=3981 RepID=A0A6A6K5N7_HEVBR|nr:hypothetical protein GH714_014594 [Hevea brasiliensis]
MGKNVWVDGSSIYGRNADKEAIVQRLLSVDEANHRALEVISIMGMGGIGKTLLTKLVYVDSRVQECFDVKAWVCAAAKFDPFKLANDILEELTSKTCDTKPTCDQLLVLDELKKKLLGKKFFLVLDDVWNDSKAEWNLLLFHLQSAGAQGSKIIVTTRSESVASAVGAVQSHVLSELSDDECWNLFAKHAFNDGHYANANQNHPRLEMISREIVKKCRGLPLIAKMLGDVLCCEKDIEQWQKISDNMELCSNYDVFMILKLTHVDLLFHLKQCLAYRIKSPKDYTFVKEKLVLSWIEEGLVRPQENKRVDDFGSRDFIIQDLAISVNENIFQCPVLGRESEGMPGYIVSRMNLFGDAMALEGNFAASGTPPLVGNVSINMFSNNAHSCSSIYT